MYPITCIQAAVTALLSIGYLGTSNSQRLLWLGYLYTSSSHTLAVARLLVYKQQSDTYCGWVTCIQESVRDLLWPGYLYTSRVYKYFDWLQAAVKTLTVVRLLVYKQQLVENKFLM